VAENSKDESRNSKEIRLSQFGGQRRAGAAAGFGSGYRGFWISRPPNCLFIVQAPQ
jgi:hypothetical protein